MRSFPPGFSDELSKEIAYFKFLFTFEWNTTKYWTDCDEDIYCNSIWYRSRDIKFNLVQLTSNPKVDSITVEIDDVDRTITTIILSESIKDKPASIYAVALDKNLQVLGTPVLIFFGYCDAARRPRSSGRFGIKIYNDMIKWKRKTPRLLCSPTCQWEFKKGPDKVFGTDSNTYTCILDHVAHTVNKPVIGGSWATYWQLIGSGGLTWYEGDWYLIGTCKYVGGGSWCDYSWERCMALSNQLNFEGLRWILSLQQKEIWWGKSRKQ